MQKTGKSKKIISVVLALLMVLSLFPAVSFVFPMTAQAYGTYTKNYSTEYYYASGTTFIKAVCVGYDSGSLSTVGSQMTSDGWTKCSNFIDMMSWDGKGDYIGIGYKTTTDPTQALTDLEFWDSDDGHNNYAYHGKNVNWTGSNTGTETINGTSYTGVKDKNTGIIFHRVGGAPFDSYRDGRVDFFRNFGSGYGYQYLCATKNRAAGGPLTALNCFSGTSSGWTMATCLARGCTNHSADHNHGPRYLGYKRLTTTVNSDTLRSNYTSALAKYNESNYSAKYTSASRTALETALTNAEAILSDLSDGYTTRDQSTINSAATALSNAVSGLTLNTYTVTFKGYTSGTTTGTLKTQTVNWGASATAPSVSTTYDSNNHYTFSSWIGTYTNVTSARTITANYTTAAHSLTGWSNNVGGASGTHKRSCSCGYVETAAHSFTSAVTTQPTCTSTGVRTYTCGVCSNQYTESVAVNSSAHNYGAWTKLNDTQHQRVCSYNSAHKEQQDHSWNSGTVSPAPTCTSTGVRTYTCSVCQGTKTETIPMADHVFTSQTTTDTYLKSAATCTDAAVYYYKCANCSAKGTETYTYGSALNHNFTSQTVTDTYLKSAATCTSPAVYYYKCTRCAEKGTNTYEYGSTIAHTPGEPVRENEVPATCKDAGSYDEVVYCSVCEIELSREEKPIAKLTTHTPGEPVRENEVPATCKDAGS